MPKLIAIYGLSGLFILCFFSFCFAQEQITITTYYPSPFGSYQDLEAHRLRVGFPAGSLPATFWDHFITVSTNAPYSDMIAIGGDNADSDVEIRVQAPLNRQTLTIWGGTGGFANLWPMRVRASNIPSCVRVRYTAASGVCNCGDWNCDGDFNDVNTMGTANRIDDIRERNTYRLAFVPATGAIYPTSGWYLCCDSHLLP